MTTEEAIAAFASYSPDEKKEFVAQFVYELTLVARDTLWDVAADAELARAVNEAQHRVSSYLWKLIRNDSRRHPDDFFVRFILDWDGDKTFGARSREIFARLAEQRSAPAWQSFVRARKCS